MKNILITSAGRRVELVRIWQDSVRCSLGTNSKVYATDHVPNLSSACQVADEHFAISRCTDPSYPFHILDKCLEHNICLVIPTIDTELLILAEFRDVFESAGVQLVISDSQLIRKCRDKRLTANLFKSLSIETPLLLEPQNLSFPCFMKPLSGSSSQGVKPIYSSGHLCQIDLDDTNNIFQEMIPSDWIEYTSDLYYSRQGDLLSCVPRQRLEARGGEISKGIIRRDLVWSFLTSRLERLEGARGAITIQVFASPARDSILGIEINPRFGGGYPMSHAAGVDYPLMLINEYLNGHEPRSLDNWQANLLMLRYDMMEISSISDSDIYP